MSHERATYLSGCRCDVCRAANTAYNAKQRARRALVEVPEGVEHGTVSTYNNWLCRCEPCSIASHGRSAAQYARSRS